MKRVLLTGAAGGIGAATAAELRGREARVVGIAIEAGEDTEMAREMTERLKRA